MLHSKIATLTAVVIALEHLTVKYGVSAAF